ncbi:putative transmembrane protein [Toxoplasma gondii RUB]|uniref:Transmembrane protein n=11 Tax=Toxoplasma gondii TaxID=5811 RepID=A0A125YHN6_TOXGV|nr:hypothetical protein TGGT1_203770 [Toxoplasma gondii GT1]ESS33116.1 putative transmembrane protein [Toxoplasma gondii VEG]KAF4642800.1 hypothetical protein TGRH88_035260 [Toxoplasma gondii]KFG37942.1 putative transmembrane protein [Toxoplasma gondii GAB2-2007-GAL-DOM2]KFG39450.1 putative transmembrane protein [Toxoplasma gondii FOU]KFG46253.1 putative transmembrane protein [Toxoplasma gondii p89]KFG61809.1 putative transmembrane protein [Toxoplasma gondii RUB]KFH05631.1 putative transmemb
MRGFHRGRWPFSQATRVSRNACVSLPHVLPVFLLTTGDVLWIGASLLAGASEWTAGMEVQVRRLETDADKNGDGSQDNTQTTTVQPEDGSTEESVVKGGHIAVFVAVGVCVICALCMCAMYAYQKWTGGISEESQRRSHLAEHSNDHSSPNLEAGEGRPLRSALVKHGTKGRRGQTKGTVSTFIADTHLGDPLKEAPTLVTLDTARWTANTSLSKKSLASVPSRTTDEDVPLPPIGER